MTSTCQKPKTEEVVWYTLLPECPCTNPDMTAVQLSDGWARDVGDTDTYHRGATVCYRSYPAIETTEGMSGQQCCYDEHGQLITSGSGAGTPDKVSTCAGEDEHGDMTINYSRVIGHMTKDVIPWNKAGGTNNGWQKYNLDWPPSQGQNCDDNPGPTSDR